MRTTEAGKAARSRATKINLHEITNNPEFAPAPCWLFPDILYAKAKRTFANVLRQNSKLAEQFSAKDLTAQMVCGDIPTNQPGKSCNALTCLAYGVTRSGEKRTVSLFDAPGTSYIYVAVNGSLCLAHFDDSTPEPRYYALN